MTHPLFIFICLENPCQIVVMFAFCHQFAMQAAAFGDGFEQWDIYVEPVETVTLYILVNHLIIHFSIVGTIRLMSKLPSSFS